MLPAALRLAAGRAPILVPVPLTRARLRERGFNQADLLALALSRRTGWPIERLLRRERGGPALARLGRRERERVAARSYSINPDSLPLVNPHPEVLIVDDVITTGATGVACAEALGTAGAQCLGIVSFARTNPLTEPS